MYANMHNFSPPLTSSQQPHTHTDVHPVTRHTHSRLRRSITFAEMLVQVSPRGAQPCTNAGEEMFQTVSCSSAKVNQPQTQLMPLS